MPTCSLCRNVYTGARCPVCGQQAGSDGPQRVPSGRVPSPPAVPAEAAPMPIVAAAPVGRAQGDLEGIVIRTHGPQQMKAPISPAKVCFGLLLCLALAPILFFLWLFKLSFRIAFGILGFGGRGSGRSLSDEIFMFHIAGTLFRRSEPIPVYQHVVETPGRLVSARQEGEFSDGRIFPGHRVRLNGRWRNGTLVIDSGQNLTLGTDLCLRRPAWGVLVGILLAVIILGTLFLHNISSLPM